VSGGGRALPDGTPVIVSGSDDGTVRVWRLADGTLLVPPLNLPEPVSGVAVHGNVIVVTAAGADIAVHKPAFPRPMRELLFFTGTQNRPAKRSDNGRLSGTSAGEPLARTSVLRRANIQPSATTGHSVHND